MADGHFSAGQSLQDEVKRLKAGLAANEAELERAQEIIDEDVQQLSKLADRLRKAETKQATLLANVGFGKKKEGMGEHQANMLYLNLLLLPQQTAASIDRPGAQHRGRKLPAENRAGQNKSCSATEVTEERG